jgi:putative tryptophan/tyrosine transport system substrate-binding protein
VKDVQSLAPKRHLQQRVVNVRNAEVLREAIQEAHRHSQAALLIADVVTLTHLHEVVSLAENQSMPVMYTMRDFVDEGGLAAYGPNVIWQYRRAAEYVDKILKGAKPNDLPIEQPTQYVLIVNLKTAKALGITIPESILFRADEVIR